jgi:nicotinamidase-related amidase
MQAIRVGSMLAIIALAITAPLGARAAAQPNHPEPQAIVVDPDRTAVLVLDLGVRCDPPARCGEIIPAINEFLPRARAAGALVVFTLSASARGTDLDRLAIGLVAANGDIMAHPDGPDKFRDGELDAILSARGIDTVIVTGASTNMAVLHTATAAARYSGLGTVIPLDAMNGNNPYDEEYGIHHLTVLSGAGTTDLIWFTTLAGIEFAKTGEPSARSEE